jgi:uncharacterized membrane protein
MPLISKVDRPVLQRLLLRTQSVQVQLTLVLLPSLQMLALPSQRANQVPHQRLLLVPLHAHATEVARMNFKIRHYLLTGLLVWLPMGVTVWLLTWLVGTMDGIFLAVLGALDAVVPGMHSLAESLRHMPGLGVILVAVVIYVTGLFVTNIFGQWWLRQWSKVITRIPVVNSIYSSVKQVADTLFSGSGNAFSKALLVQYPHQGSWTIAFLTGAPGGQVARHLPSECVSVYVPTTPNPTSGFFLIMPKANVVELDMTVDDALKYIISMGVVVPGGPDTLPVKTEPAPSV